MSGFQLRHLSFQGPHRPLASLEFGPGLNVVYGASDTGKSFVVDTIDFMLGGGKPLRQFPQREGYDRIFLGIETASGELFTLQRSIEGGAFLLHKGLVVRSPSPGDEPPTVLQDRHHEQRYDNVSMFLLKLCALDGKRVKRNKFNITNNLSFRNVARLAIVDELEIMGRESPFFDGNPHTTTVNRSTFRLLLTGVDDSALVQAGPTQIETVSRDAQLELLDEMIDRDRRRLRALTKDESDIDAQAERLDNTLLERTAALSARESEYKRLRRSVRKVRLSHETAVDRLEEVSSLLERFRLLDVHYQSDLARLLALQEAGTLFDSIARGPCPLCGAAPDHHQREAATNVDVPATVLAAAAETRKIRRLRTELAETVSALRKEGTNVQGRAAKYSAELDVVSAALEQQVAPRLEEARASYKKIADTQAKVKQAQFVRDGLNASIQRRADIETSVASERDPGSDVPFLASGVAEAFSKQVEHILSEWRCPDSSRVFFDIASGDLVIDGKQRGSRGKGLRAITHAAFNLAILECCRQKGTPHPGFVVLDSPLVSYRQPDGAEDDLRGTDVKERFFSDSAQIPTDRQVLIVDNVDPPVQMVGLDQFIYFSGLEHSTHRYGLFPGTSEEGRTPSTGVGDTITGDE